MTGSPARLTTDEVLRRAVLIAAALAMAVMLVRLGRGLTFWYDEWSIILDRPDPSLSSLLAPHVDHLSVIPVLLYQALMRIVGLGTYWPYLAVSWICHLICVVALYRIVTAIAAPWLGLVAACSLLFLGAAFEDLLHAFQSSFMISAAAGLVAIDVLRSAVIGPRRLVAATALLLVAVGSSSVGVILTGLVLVWGGLGRRRPLLVAGLAVAAVYALWYVSFGRSGAGPVGDPFAQPSAVLVYLVVGLGAAVAAPLGLPPAGMAAFGFVIGAVAAVRTALAGLRPTALGMAAVAALLAQFGLQALFRSGFGPEHAARSAYLYPATICLWIVVADLVRDRAAAASTSVRITVALLLCLAIAGNLTQLHGAGNAMVGLRSTILAELRFAVAARDTPGLASDVAVDPVLLPQVTMDRYLRAVDRFGAPALALEADGFRIEERADAQAVDAAAIRLLEGGFQDGRPGGSPVVGQVTGGAVAENADGCVTVTPTTASSEVRFDVRVGPGAGIRVLAAAGVPVAAGARIQAQEGTPLPEPLVQRLTTVGLIPPVLPTGAAWHVVLSATGPFQVCPHTGR